MNIIANNCVGARIYEALKIQYNNPFMWCLLNKEDMYYLIRHFDDIDFQNITIGPSPLGKEIPNFQDSFLVRVDDAITIHYPHYQYREDVAEPTKVDVNILWKNIEEYVRDKYNARTKRMPKETPTFVLTPTQIMTVDDILWLIQHIKDRRVFAILPKGTEVKDKPANVHVVYYGPETRFTGQKADLLIKAYSNFFKK